MTTIEKTKERIAIMQAYVDGKTVEILAGNGDWFEIAPNWDWESCEYRIKPAPPAKQLIIPWDVIKSQYKWAAMDEDGSVFIYSEEPTTEFTMEEKTWYPKTLKFESLQALAIDTDGVQWDKSLVQRPE